MFDLTVVVPVYCAESTIGPMIEQLDSLRSNLNIEYVFVEDGSIDNSYSTLCQAVSHSKLKAKLIRHSKNYGEHQSVLTAYRLATAPYIVNLDDDLQHPPAEAIRLYEYAKANDLDVAYGIYEKKMHAQWRNLGSRFANLSINFLLGLPFTHKVSSFRCISAFAAKQISSYDGPYPYIDSMLANTTQHFGYLKVTHHPRKSGQSNYSLVSLLRLWLNVCTISSYAPLRLSSYIGILSFLIGLLLVFALLIQYMIYGVDVSGWTSLILATVLIGSIQLLIIGLLGEYLGRVFMTISLKPQSCVRELKRLNY